MRLKYIITLLSLLGFICALQPASIQAQITCGGTTSGPCSGPCGVQEITYSTTFNNSPWVYCPSGECVELNCTDNDPSCNGNAYDPYSTDPFCPDGHGNVTCTQRCVFGSTCSGGNSGCAYETAQIICNCSPTATPTPNPTGGGGGTGTPTPSASPSPTTSLIQGSIHLDTDASLSGNFCAQSTPSPLSLTGWTLLATKIPNTYSATFGPVNPHTYSIDTTAAGIGYTVLLNLTNQSDTNYVCSCPAPFNPEDPYRCRYTGVTSPSAAVNFYLKDRDLANDSWFQIFGGNLFATGLISSPVPASHCDGSPNCQTALTAPSVQTNTSRSSGFPISASGNATSIRSSANTSTYHSYLHLPTRPANLNSYALNTTLANLSYDYFYKLAENQLTEIGNGEDLEPLLSDWTNSAWWQEAPICLKKVLRWSSRRRVSIQTLSYSTIAAVSRPTNNNRSFCY